MGDGLGPRPDLGLVGVLAPAGCHVSRLPPWVLAERGGGGPGRPPVPSPWRLPWVRLPPVWKLWPGRGQTEQAVAECPRACVLTRVAAWDVCVSRRPGCSEREVAGSPLAEEMTPPTRSPSRRPGRFKGSGLTGPQAAGPGRTPEPIGQPRLGRAGQAAGDPGSAPAQGRLAPRTLLALVRHVLPARVSGQPGGSRGLAAARLRQMGSGAGARLLSCI